MPSTFLHPIRWEKKHLSIQGFLRISLKLLRFDSYYIFLSEIINDHLLGQIEYRELE